MMTVIAAPAMAQDVNPATQEVSNILKANANNPKEAGKQVAAYAKQFKKDPKALAAIGRAYLQIKDYANAQKYGEMSSALGMKAHVADGFILLGEIASAQEDGGTATMQYQQAMAADPKDPEGYRRYAAAMSRVSPTDAVSTLEKLRAERPDYPVDLIAAEIQSRAGNHDSAIEYYGKVGKDKMKDYQLTDYALELLLKQDFNKSLEVSLYGNEKFPRYGALNRISMYNYVNTNRFEEALVYADRLFNKSDSANINMMDLQSYGLALHSVKKYDEAIETYKKIFDLESATEDGKNEANKSISDSYKEMGNYTEAGAWYDKYMKGVKQLSAYIVGNLAAIYTAQATDEKSTADEKAAAVAKADAVYADMAEKFPSVADYAVLQRAHLPFMLDPEDKEGKAKPHYEKLIEIVNAKADKNATDNNRLIECYRYLMSYYFLIAKDTENAKVYVDKILEIDPANEQANAVKAVLK